MEEAMRDGKKKTESVYIFQVFEDLFAELILTFFLLALLLRQIYERAILELYSNFL